MLSLADDASSTKIRPLLVAASNVNSRAFSRLAPTYDVTKEPFPKATNAAASSKDAYGINVLTGPNASISWARTA